MSEINVPPFIAIEYVDSLSNEDQEQYESVLGEEYIRNLLS